MPKFHNTLKVNASTDKTWAIVGNLSGVDKWIPGIINVRVEGNSKRICSFDDGTVLHENIIDYSNKKRSYHYNVSGLPMPVQNYHGRFAVEGGGKGSVIIWDAEFEMLDPSKEAEVTRMFDEVYKQCLESLREQIER